MIELIASSPDGWGIAQEDQHHWLVHPPYRDRDRHRLTVAQVERAVVDEDFVATSRSFDGWGELCRHLRDEVVRQATPQELEAAREAPLRLLPRATAEQARRHLERLRQELHRAQPARLEEAMIALLKSEAVASDPALVKKVQELLAHCQQARRELHRSNAPQRAWPVTDDQGVEMMATAIRDRRMVLALPPAA